MVAYNFQQRFVPLIESGQKTQTIRATGNRRHAKPDEPIQLYTGMRTRLCRKIVDPDPICLCNASVIVFDTGCSWFAEAQQSWMKLDAEEFGRADGFSNWSDMRDWFAKTHGLPFIGRLIRWRPPTAGAA